MGLFDDDEELEALLEETDKLASKYLSYIRDLNEGTVQAIFNRCLTKEDITEYIKSILYQKEDGYEQDSALILFDRKSLLANLKHIRYLYGQLTTTHKDKWGQ